MYSREIDNPAGEPALVLAADTIVVSRDGRVLEKPKSRAEHVTMLKNLRDNGAHQVRPTLRGGCVWGGGLMGIGVHGGGGDGTERYAYPPGV